MYLLGPPFLMGAGDRQALNVPGVTVEASSSESGAVKRILVES